MIRTDGVSLPRVAAEQQAASFDWRMWRPRERLYREIVDEEFGDRESGKVLLARAVNDLQLGDRLLTYLHNYVVGATISL